MTLKVTVITSVQSWLPHNKKKIQHKPTPQGVGFMP